MNHHQILIWHFLWKDEGPHHKYCHNWWCKVRDGAKEKERKKERRRIHSSSLVLQDIVNLVYEVPLLCKIFLWNLWMGRFRLVFERQRRHVTKRNITPSPCTTCFVRATSDGFRSLVSWFLLLELLIVCCALSGAIFCLDFGPFFFLFLLCFICECFSFIYLF